MRCSVSVRAVAAIAIGVAAPTLGQVINEDLKLLASDGAESDYFGVSIAIAIAIDNGIVAVGAKGDDDNSLDSGSAYVFDVGSNADCLDLTVENLVARERATFVLARGTPGAKAATVYGTKPGEVTVTDYAGFCATISIVGIKQERVIGGLSRTFDANGEILFGLNVPGKAAGLNVLFQSAQHGTCPDECTSNLVDAIVQ